MVKTYESDNRSRKSVFGRDERGKEKEWYDDECKAAIQERAAEDMRLK